MKFLPVNEFRTERRKLDLNGRWDFSYDPDEIGVRDKWYLADCKLSERIRVPGCSQVRKFGSGNHDRENFDGLPELFPGVLLKYPCDNSAWYKRNFKLPASWKQHEDIWLHAGGIMPAAEFWLNGQHLGATVSSRTPYRICLSRYVKHGEANCLAVRVFRPPVGLIGVFDSLCGWSGIYRGIWLEVTDKIHVQSFHVVPSVSPTSVTVNLTCFTRRLKAENIRVQCRIADLSGEQVYSYSGRAELSRKCNNTSFTVSMPEAKLWDCDHPDLYRAEVSLSESGVTLDTAAMRFGLREVKTDGFRVMLNGAPVFLRGACDDQLYVDTVCPPADKEYFKTRIMKAKQYGFNYTKSCVELFTEEFLEAADECGYLVCQEMPFFDVRNRGIRYRLPSDYTRCYKRELKHILIASRSHASACFYSMSSELSTPWTKNRRCFQLYSQILPEMTREMAPNALIFDVTGASCGPELGKNSVPVDLEHGRRVTDLQGSWLRWAMDGCPLMGPITGIDKNVTKPFILHEFAWITALTEPALGERLKKTPIKALHIKDMVRAAVKNNQGDILDQLVRSSQKLKYVLRKHAFELARQNPKIAGYHHWLIHDFPFCAEGVLNEFWEAPDDMSSDEFLTYNHDTVLCLDDGDRRSFFGGDVAGFSVNVSHFGREDLRTPEIHWDLCDRKGIVLSGELALETINRGSLAAGPEFSVRFPESQVAQQYELKCSLFAGGNLINWNHWLFWSFPKDGGRRQEQGVSTSLPEIAEAHGQIALRPSPSLRPGDDVVFVTDQLDESVREFTANGGNVLLFDCRRDGVFPKADGSLYRTVPYNLGKTGNMGTLIGEHPIFDDFPHEGWCELCFAPLIQGSWPVDLTCFRPERIDPIIRSIGHMRTMADKAYLFEIRVGKGRLMICCLNIPGTTGNPLSSHLLHKMTDYLAKNG